MSNPIYSLLGPVFEELVDDDPFVLKYGKYRHPLLCGLPHGVVPDASVRDRRMDLFKGAIDCRCPIQIAKTNTPNIAAIKPSRRSIAIVTDDVEADVMSI